MSKMLKVTGANGFQWSNWTYSRMVSNVLHPLLILMNTHYQFLCATCLDRFKMLEYRLLLRADGHHFSVSKRLPNSCYCESEGIVAVYFPNSSDIVSLCSPSSILVRVYRLWG
jgi:hypothetical protein